MRTLLLLIPIVLLASEGLSNPLTNQPASSVLGQPDFDSAAAANPPNAQSQLSPTDVVIDPATGKVFVSDRGNHRVLRYSSVAAYQTHSPAEFVFGQTDFDLNDYADPPTAGSFYDPAGMLIDGQGRLWVADYGNNRIVRYDNAATLTINGSPANAVFGQSDFVSNDEPGTSTAHSHFYGPWDVDLDQEGNLYVADYENSRILRFDNANALVSGAPLSANAVLGQPDLMSFNFGLSSSALNYPYSLAIDVTGRLWVADSGNHRVLRFDDAANKMTGDPADGVLGQPDFDTSNQSLGASGMRGPSGVKCGAGGMVWVSDARNSRVLGFLNGASKVDGGSADIVLGQPDFDTDNDAAASSQSMLFPEGIALTPQQSLLVADSGANRVLYFQSPNVAPEIDPNAALKAALEKKIKKLKKQLKGAKRKQQRAKAKRLKGKLKKLQKRLRALS